jgi:hypothetical protein
MSFIATDLMPLIQTARFNLWHYRSADLKATIVTPGYFAAAAARLQAGDVMIVQSADSMAILPLRSNVGIGPGVTLDGAVTPIALTRTVAQTLRMVQAAGAVVATIILAPLVAGVIMGSAIPVQAQVIGPISSVIVTLRNAQNQVIPPCEPCRSTRATRSRRCPRRPKAPATASRSRTTRTAASWSPRAASTSCPTCSSCWPRTGRSCCRRTAPPSPRTDRSAHPPRTTPFLNGRSLMPDLRISELPAATAVADSDLTPFVQVTPTPSTKRASLSQLRRAVLADRGVDVRDFGAVGDGTANDAPAIQAAINALGAAGGTVNLGARTYRLNSAITISSNSVRLQGAGFAEGGNPGDGTWLTVASTAFTPITFTGVASRARACTTSPSARRMARRRTHPGRPPPMTSSSRCWIAWAASTSTT